MFSCEVDGTIFNFSKVSGNMTHSSNISDEIHDKLSTAFRLNRQCVCDTFKAGWANTCNHL